MDAPRTLADALDDLLPQTQCGKCGYAGCRPYAEAMAIGNAPINRCPPGGTPGITQLAALLKVEVVPLDPACGREGPERLALIDEDLCIGCTLCILACPVDAIAGAAKRMHSVLLAHCTGCELCLPPCPVDCIELIERDALALMGAKGAQTRTQLDEKSLRHRARDRYHAHVARLRSSSHAVRQAPAPPAMPASDLEMKRQTVARALQRARERRATPGSA